MSEPKLPWRSERDLDPDGVRAVVRRQLGLPAESVELLGAGWDSDAYLVDGLWVFRFPRREEVVPYLLTEVAVLPRLQPCLPVSIPEPRFVGEPCDRFPFSFAGYRVLPGVAAKDAPGANKGRVLEQVFDMLAALHAVELEGPIAEITGWGFDVVAESRSWTRRLGLQDEPPLKRALEWLEERTLKDAGTRVLTHHDLGFEHVLVDPSDSRVTGVIDWGDMELAEPAHDFVGALRWASRDEVARALDRSRYPATPTLLEHAATRLVHMAAVRWCQAVDYRKPEWIEGVKDVFDRFVES